jgi:hypothetical protein
MDKDKRDRAYRAAAHITREQLRRDAPERADILAAVEKADVVVVAGIYDHVESVLEALEVPHTVVGPEDVDQLALRPEQLLIVNCPGQVSSAAVTRIRGFVEAGGSLFTTDWALKHVLEPAFPRVLAFEKAPTPDDVVRIEVKDRENIYLQGVLDGQDDPQWWLEASSYPISIVDTERVQVLITSRELGEKYGEAPVAVWFRWGEGDVFHMISHYYLQRTELRTARHQAPAARYFDEKTVAMTDEMSADVADLCLSEVESAKPSSAFMANVIIEKKRRQSKGEA